VEGTITLIEPIFDEGKKHAVLFILVREKAANMSESAQQRTCRPDWCR
jgi:hypothetical protein